MRAAVRDRYGPPESVRVEEVDRPEPADDQVLVRVRAASINRADLDGLYPRWQFTRLFTGLRRPKSRRLGLDVAGVVEAVGPQVTAFQVGDAVFADLSLSRPGQGAFAEFVCERGGLFSRMPDGLGFEDAATLPHAGILALQGLRRRDGRTFEPGARVLIEGASGNVGPFAVQIAKARGAEVTGVCSPEKVEFVRSLGADHVIDYRSLDYTKSTERYDWILAVDAHHSLLGSQRALAPGGVFVALGGPSGWMLSSIVVTPAIALATDRWAGMMFWWKPFAPDDVAALKDLVAAGAITPRIDRRYPLDEVVAALRHVDEGRPAGKVVVLP